jgi:hypothetical protein
VKLIAITAWTTLQMTKLPVRLISLTAAEVFFSTPRQRWGGEVGVFPVDLVLIATETSVQAVSISPLPRG